MVTFPNCKINLGLNILRKRADGYHDIESVFLPVPWYDVLEITPSSTEKTSLKVTGLPSGFPSDNLCLKAYYLIKKDHPDLPEISINLHKTIPAGAGLGGGSADAAFMLLKLNKIYDLKIPLHVLKEYAQQLGSDCPFFLLNQPAFTTGKGENLEPVDLSFAGLKMLIIHPLIHINTGEIFKEIIPFHPEKSIKTIIQQPFSSWKDELKNDFETIVFPKYPLLKEIKNNLYKFGAVYVFMTGTGSTIVAFFIKDHSEDFPINSTWISKWINI